jgi:SAM-dependent methyltransferase
MNKNIEMPEQARHKSLTSGVSSHSFFHPVFVHPVIYRKISDICAERHAGGDVLEIGAVPSDDSLLCLACLSGARSRVGLNLDGPAHYRDFEILRGNANAMDCFADASFDTILCNATLEHDAFFWKTLSEIRRVARKGAVVVIGVPGYAKVQWESPMWRFLRLFSGRKPEWLRASTPTLIVHNCPGDYYRFSPQAMQEVFFQGFINVQVDVVLVPPRIIGSGVFA